jgi:hypothetical protein
VGNHIATKSRHDRRKDSADFSGSDHANGFAEKIEADQAVERKIEFSDASICFMNFSVE